MTIIGFTGTRQGMTRLQMDLVKTLLKLLSPEEVHHGDCVGSDAQFHKIICDEVRASIIIHPPTNPRFRAFCVADETRGDKILPEKEYLERNKDIIDSSDIIIAAPGSYQEERRRGTWHTIRNARKEGKRIYIIYPNGTVEEEP